MLLTLLVWAYTLFLCWIYGAWFFKNQPPALTVIAGMAVLTVFAEFFSLFFPLGWLIHLILLAGAIFLLATHRLPRPEFNLSVPGWLPLLVLLTAAVLVLVSATSRPSNPDTSLYHAQAIRWLETYPAVPGLGNLHGRLAFNSAWLVTNALFSFAFLGLGSLHLSASVLFLSAFALFWPGLRDLQTGRVSAASLLRLGFLPLGFYVLGGELSSPGTDLPVSLLIWVVTLLSVESAETDQPGQLLLITLLASFAVTVKLSALPLLLLCLPALWGAARRQLWQVAVCAGLVLLPFLARNVILSGYLLYPFPALNWFSFDWKIPFQRVEDDRLDVLRFGRLGGPGELPAHFAEWFPLWWLRQTLNRRIIFIAALLTPLSALLARFKRPRLWAGWAALYTGVLFWLFSAPDYRFGYGFLLATLLTALAPWFPPLLRRWPLLPTRSAALASGLLLAYLGLTLVLAFEPQTFTARLLLPAGYDRAPVEACGLANGQAWCARDFGFCSYADLPCTPSARYWVELRGPTLRSGFRAVQP